MVVRIKELATFCYGVITRMCSGVKVSYCGLFYRVQKEADLSTTVHFHFIVVKDLNPCIKVNTYLVLLRFDVVCSFVPTALWQLDFQCNTNPGLIF